jgi:hypothetical protein
VKGSRGAVQVAERMITSDLEFLIAKAVDTSKADYAGRLPASATRS